MSATDIHSIQKIPAISVPHGESGAILPLLELAILQSHAHGAYIYRLQRDPLAVKLVALAGPEPPCEELTLPQETAALHANRKTPVVLRSSTASDSRFTGFPEFRSGRFDGVISVPLLDSGESVGLANFCRAGDAPLSGQSLSFLLNLSVPLGALLAAAVLRRQLQKANRELADRKLVERAKGLVQVSFGWTEEQAYLSLRRMSRRRRIPMREIARTVIECGPQPLLEVIEAHE